jgi:hypothetical protein
MRTAMHKRTLVLLAAIAWMAPLSAHQNAGAVKHHSSGCPYERAREAAAAAAAARAWQPAPKPATTTITLKDRVPGGSLLGWGDESGFLRP